MDKRDPEWWEKEIKRKSTSNLNTLAYILIFLLICLVLFSAYIYAYLPAGGKIRTFEISENVARLIVYMTTIISVIGITLSGIWRLYNPCFTRYLYTALEIINNLEKIDDKKKQSLRDIVIKKLECCTDRDLKKECKKALEECCEELAELLKTR